MSMGLTLRERMRTRYITSREDSACVISSCVKMEAAEQGRADASGGGTADERALGRWTGGGSTGGF